MKTQNSNKRKILLLCFCALFVAIICACTLIAIPLPIGFFNLGDAACLMAAYVLGPVFGTMCAAIGSALADLLLGYAVYAPATAIVKGAMALCACLIFRALTKKGKLQILPLALAAVVGEAIMVAGYFVYEALVLGFGMGALASVLGNTTQGVCGAVISTVLMTVFIKVPQLKKALDYFS